MWSLLVRRSSIVLLVAVIGLGAGACGGDEDQGTDAGEDSPSGADDNGGSSAAATVELKAVTFEPSEVTVKVGETVEWKWGGGVQHNVKGDGFKSELQTKGTFEHTFAEAGTFAFMCDVHPATMKGTITVT